MTCKLENINGEVFNYKEPKYHLFFQKIRYDHYLLIHTFVDESVNEEDIKFSKELKEGLEMIDVKWYDKEIEDISKEESNENKKSFFDKVQEHNDFIEEMDELHTN